MIPLVPFLCCHFKLEGRLVLLRWPSPCDPLCGLWSAPSIGVSKAPHLLALVFPRGFSASCLPFANNPFIKLSSSSPIEGCSLFPAGTPTVVGAVLRLGPPLCLSPCPHLRIPIYTPNSCTTPSEWKA